jgi:hypothetical protein
MVFASLHQASAANKKPKTAPPAKTKTQWVKVDKPYCDTYQPYHYPGSTPPPAGSNVTDPIGADGSFNDPGTKILGRDNDQLSPDGSDLTRLLTRLFKRPAPNTCDPSSKTTPSPPTDDYQYVLLHVVHWQKEKGSSYNYSSENSEWYVFNRSDDKAARRQFPFTFHPYVSSDLRMFGSDRVLFLAIHLSPKNLYADFKGKVQIDYKVTVQKVEPMNQQDLGALLDVVLPGLKLKEELQPLAVSPTPPNFDGIYGASLLTGLDNLPVQITPEMDAKLPPPDDTTEGIANGGGGAVTSKSMKKMQKAAAVGQPNTQTAASTSAGCATQTTPNTPGSTQSGDCTEKVTVQDEGLYWWDISVGVPFKSYKDLQVSNGNVTTTTTVSKKTAYGFLMLAPWKEDIITPPSLGIPHILMGLPFTGKVLDSPFVGLGETINLTKLPGIGNAFSKFTQNLSIRFYAGLSENKVFEPAPAPGTPGPVKWVGKLQYGIEFSIADVKSKLTGTNSSTSK